VDGAVRLARATLEEEEVDDHAWRAGGGALYELLGLVPPDAPGPPDAAVVGPLVKRLLALAQGCKRVVVAQPTLVSVRIAPTLRWKLRVAPALGTCGVMRSLDQVDAGNLVGAHTEPLGTCGVMRRSDHGRCRRRRRSSGTCTPGLVLRPGVYRSPWWFLGGHGPITGDHS
jgi:hypothetical protein